MFKLNNPVKLNSTFGRSQKRQFNPLQYSPALWLDASDQSTRYQQRISPTTLATANSDPVGTWLDKSGNARNAVANSDSTRLTLRKNGRNGRDVLVSDGVDDFMSTGLSASLGKFLHNDKSTVFIVVSPGVSATPNKTFIVGTTKLGSSANIGYAVTIQTASGVNRVLCDISAGSNNIVASVTTANGSITPQNAVIISTVADCTNGTASERLAVYINGSETKNNTASATPSANNSAQAFWLWAGTTFEEYVCEYIIYSSILSASQRQQVERYLAEKWMSPPVVTLTASSTIQHLEWDAVPMATGYEVYYKLSSSNSWVLVTTTTSLWAVVQDLAVGSTYDYRVDAIWSV